MNIPAKQHSNAFEQYATRFLMLVNPKQEHLSSEQEVLKALVRYADKTKSRIEELESQLEEAMNAMENGFNKEVFKCVHNRGIWVTLGMMRKKEEDELARQKGSETIRRFIERGEV